MTAPTEAKITLPITVKRDDCWEQNPRTRRGRYRKRFVALFEIDFAQQRRNGFLAGHRAWGSTATEAKTKLTDALTRILTEFTEPEIIKLGECFAVVYCRPDGFERGITWAYHLAAPQGRLYSHGTGGGRDEATQSAVSTLCQEYMAIDWWDRDRIEAAAVFAEERGQSGRDQRVYAACQRGYAYAASIGERDPHGWMFDRQSEFLERWDRPESSAEVSSS